MIGFGAHGVEIVVMHRWRFGVSILGKATIKNRPSRVLVIRECFGTDIPKINIMRPQILQRCWGIAYEICSKVRNEDFMEPQPRHARNSTGTPIMCLWVVVFVNMLRLYAMIQRRNSILYHNN